MSLQNLPRKKPDSPLASMAGHHVALRVPDYEAEKRWFVEKLDFRVVHEWPYADQRLAYVAPPNDDSFYFEILGDGLPPPIAKATYSDLSDSLRYAGYHHACLKTWLITGVSTGLGRAIAEAALAAGDQVVGTLRDPGMRSAFEALAPGRARSRLLDVRDAEAVNAAVADLGSVDVLVNNAGYGLVGAIEEVTLSQARDQLEVNFFGALSMIQAVLPGMRRSGHILNITSIGGLLAFPGLGLYHASKFALEGLSEALAKELAPFDVRVTAIEPGAFRTDWAGRSMQHATRLPDYATTAGAFRSAVTASSGKQPGDPRKAAQAIVDLVLSSHPPTRLLLGSDALGYATEKLHSMRADIEAWAEVTRSTDF